MNPDDAITVKYSTDGKEFEILVKPDEALEYREGKNDDFSKILFVREVFKDASAADRASSEDLESVFNTKVIKEAAKEIFEKGKLELTTKQKQELREKKRKQVVNMIARQSMNPQNNSPHPPKRIENAMDEAGVNIDPLESAEKQMSDVVDRIRPKIPLSFEEKTVAIRIPNKYAGKCYGVIKDKAEVEEEEWGDKFFFAKASLKAGVEPELESRLEEKTHGNVEIKDV